MENEKLYAVRHSLAHIMAAAIQRIYGADNVKFGVGPVVENGFYYDVDLGDAKIGSEDFPRIEKEMRKIIAEKQDFVRSEKPIDAAIEWAKESNQPYKLELLNDLKRAGTTIAKDLDTDELGLDTSGDSKTEKVSFYTNGDFTDLCRGPHVANSAEIPADAFRLVKISGAYWRGSEKNPMMTRIYGVAFGSKAELENFLQQQEEAAKRDHRKLGQELDLFAFSDLVGAGLPLYTPRGTIIIDELKKILNEMGKKHGYLQVSIPHLAKIELYETSGHAQKFGEELFRVVSHYDQEFILKPVNCPHHTQIYAARPRSYRDLPLRYIEQTMQYRDEKPGAIGGLQRTRGFTVDDGHTFCRVDQIEQEVSSLVEIIRELYESIGLWGNHWVSWSIRDPEHPEKYIGYPEDWNTAEKMLFDVAEKYQLDARRMDGEAALYGPKLDFMFKDSLGRETQLATVQIDFAMPKRFGLNYVDQDGQEQTPVMIHRAIFGSFERFIMLLIEHFAGKFPVWLSPEQLRIIKVKDDNEKVNELCGKILKLAEENGVRVTLDDSNNSVGKKIRNAEIWKVPYSIVVGDKEADSGLLPLRIRNDLAAANENSERVYAPEKLMESIAGEARDRARESSL